MPNESPRRATPPVRRELVRCAFCGRSAKHVRRLVRVPTGFVCDVCVDACADLIQEALSHPIAPDVPRLLSADLDTQCAVCDTVVQQDEAVAVEGRGGPVCRACVDAIVAAWWASGDESGRPQ